MSQSLTQREVYIKSIFLPENRSKKKEYLSEEKVNEIIKSISSIGERYGFIGGKENKNIDKSSKRKHKYDVWVAIEIKKNMALLDDFEKIRLIIDWATQTKSNIFSFSFEKAFEEQELWHKKAFERYGIKNIEIKNVEKDKVLFRCSDKKHFIYLLDSNDLTHEGEKMGICVGGDNYKANVKNERSIIVSLRDEKNFPHVTTEIGVNSGTILQQVGKGNSLPLSEYRKMIIEFVLFATNYNNFENNEELQLLNLNQIN